jgi:hypothetical protein
MRFRSDILDGVGETSGISLDDFVASHMSKLTYYRRAVQKFGNEGALIRLKNLNFRDFLKELVEKDPVSKHSSKQAVGNDLGSVSVYDDQKAMILDLNLAPNEKRALHMIARKSIYYPTSGLTEEQVIEADKRLRQRRIDAFANNLIYGVPTKFQRKAYDPDDPLAISEGLYEIRHLNDAILRIRSGLSLAMPARRTIAVLLFRLHSENETFKSQWKCPHEGVKYNSFRDFSIQELGMGEDYRDYLVIGKVIRDYYYFLDWLTDMDTEAVFLKLRYLPKALNTHKGDEPLVLARLRSLTVREFRAFSEDPDFEITFSKRLTKKQMASFNDLLSCIRNPHDPLYQNDFVELYDESEKDWVYVIEQNLLAESRKENDPSDLLALTPRDVNGDKLIPENKTDSTLVA